MSDDPPDAAELWIAPEPVSKRAKPIPREAWRQEKAVKFAAAAIMCAHTVMAFDRSMARGDWSHRFEAKRGVRAGTPDMLIIALAGQAHHHIWIEWKAEGNKPNDNQNDGLALLHKLGDVAKWCVRIEEFCRILTNCGLPMAPNAALMAMQYDGMVDSRIAKAEAQRDGAAPVVKRAPRKTTARSTFSVKQGHRAGAWARR